MRTAILNTITLFASLALVSAQSCDCPDDFSVQSFNEDCFCCPGTLNSPLSALQGDFSGGYCCVHGPSDNFRRARAIPALSPRQAVTTNGQTCLTVIPMTASNYAELALSASTLTETGGAADSSATSTVAVSSASASSTNAVSETNSAGTTSSASSQASSSSSASAASGNYAPAVTAMGNLMAGGAVLALLI